MPVKRKKSAYKYNLPFILSTSRNLIQNVGEVIPSLCTIGRYVCSNIYWIFPSLIATLVAVVVAYHQFHKEVQATLHLPYLNIETNDDKLMSFKLEFLVNNKGNLPLHLHNAQAYIINKDARKDSLLALINNDTTSDRVITAGNLKSFTLTFSFEKEFITKGARLAREKYHTDDVNLPVTLGVILLGGDDKFWIAKTNVPINFSKNNIYTNEVNFGSTVFKVLDPCDPKYKANLDDDTCKNLRIPN